MNANYYRVDPEHTGEYGREVRIFGPPGTGKTTFLTGSIRNTVLLRGNHNVVVASFTRAAAAELQGRDLGLPKSQLGTLHSLARRSIGGDAEIAEDHLDDWNNHHPAWSRAGKSMDLDDGVVRGAADGAREGDDLAGKIEVKRSKRIPLDEWQPGERSFYAAWCDWKAANDLIDFHDMIEIALTDAECAPGNPDVGFFDEVQDFTPLELALVRKWGQRMERVVLAGDDDQCIYSFKGATPDTFLNPPIPDSDKIILSQSWRIPATVHRAAEAWISKLGHREPKVYSPRSEEGVARYIPVDHRDSLGLLRRVETALGQEFPDAQGVQKPATVMVLASAAYMLQPLISELRSAGLPFHNPYQLKRGDWNPMRPASSRGTTSRERLLAYLSLDERAFPDGPWHRPDGWTGLDVKRWAHAVKKTGVFARGAGAAIEALPDGVLDFDTLAALFKDEVVLEQAVTPDLDWYANNLGAANRSGMAFPLQVARRQGPAALVDPPRLVVGTIHSVKGAQADVVFLVPDLSPRSVDEWRRPRGSVPHDSIRRLFYVGMTRARHELNVLEGTRKGRFVVPEQLLAGVGA